ncbi:MAG: LamG domain-containing protein, partial [Desulfobacterales bacterium]|nr:LamG domain-containing protein [Desulfobacterales bacterium]
MYQKQIYLSILVLLLTSGIGFGALEGLVGHWTLDDGSGTVVTDSSEHANDGVLQGTPRWVDGHIKGALSFNGSTDYVEVPHSTAFETITNQVTICAWINVDNFINWAAIVGKGTGPSPWNMQIWGDGSLRTAPNYGNPPGSVGRQNINSSAKMVTGIWTHAAVTCDGSTIRFYINGVEDTAGAVNIEVVFGSNTQAMIIGADFPGGDEYFDGTIDDVWVFNRALSTQEVADVMAGRTGVSTGLASEPSPADEATDVPRDADLNWTPGEFANTHDVYFGTAFNNVNDADRTNPLGVLAGQNQGANTYDPAARLDFGQTYYWRVDEVNAPPDSTIFKGHVWNFTAEPFAYPIEVIIATASSSAPDQGPENTVNGSGLDDSGLLHGNDSAGTMWLSSLTGVQPSWIA